VEGLTHKVDPPWLVKIRNAVKELEVKPKEQEWQRIIRVGLEDLNKVNPTPQPNWKERLMAQCKPMEIK
jgi:hypothetical protein